MEHRYDEEGCDVGKHSDGERALLLEFGERKRKKVPGMTRTGLGRIGVDWVGDGENASERDVSEDFDEGDFGAEPLRKKFQGTVMGKLGYVSRVLIKPDPKTTVTVKRTAARKKDVKKVVKEAVLVGARKKTKRKSSGSRGVLTSGVTSEISELPAPSAAAEVSSDRRLEGIVPSLRTRLVKEKGSKHGGQTMPVMNVTDTGRSLGIPSIREHVKRVRFAAAEPNGRKRKSPDVPDGGDQHVMVLQRDPPEKEPAKRLEDDKDDMIREPYISPEEALSKIVVWEEVNNENEALLGYWGNGNGSLDLVSYHPGIQSKFQARREALKRLEEENESAVRSRAEEKLKKSTPPLRPTEPPFPGLWHLWPWAAVVRLPWDWACDDATEFRSRWESNITTEAFKFQLRELVFWWNAKKHSLSAYVSKTVSFALDSVIISSFEQVVYPELDTLCAYFQYSKELETFEGYEARLEEKREEAVKQAWLEFKRENSRLYEEVTWDWCPFWRILMSTDNLQGLGLPELPWEHNCSESLRVRRALTRSRVEPIPPLPLVRVLRILFWSYYGVFRQLTCPIYGLTEHLILKLCEDDLRLKRAISLYALQGRYLFTGLECESPKTIRHRLMLEVEGIRDGRGAKTVSSVMSWVRTVQLRAIQDQAATQAAQFDVAWCIREHELWANQWEHWGQTLRAREDIDMGWFWSIRNAYPPRLGAVRGDLEAKVSSLALHIQDDDVRHWQAWVHSGVHGASGGSSGMGSPDGRGTQAPANFMHCVSEETEMGDARFADGTKGTVEESMNPSDNSMAVTNDGVGDPEVPAPKEVGVAGSEAAPATDIDISAAGERKHSSCPPCRVSVSQPPSSHDPYEFGVNMEDHANVDESDQETQAVHQPVALSKRQNLAGPPSSQQTAIDDPYEFGVNMDDHAAAELCADVDVGCESDQETQAVNQRLNSAGSPPSGIPEDEIWDSSGLGTSGAMVVVSEHLAALTLWNAYSFLGIEKLLWELPVVGPVSIARESVVFYNQFQKEHQVMFSNIRELKEPKTWLGTDIVDFVMSRIYMQYPSRHRHQIHIASSRVSTALDVVIRNGEGVEKFAKCFLRPPPPYRLQEVTEVIVPWVSAKHWSLLVLRPNKWYHLDSLQNGTHSPRGKDSEFVRLLYAGWQYLRGEQESAVLTHGRTRVFQQPGNDECGHNMIRNVLVHLKHRPTNPRPVLTLKHGEFLIPVRHQGILTQIMALLAREIDPAVRDTRFKAPFCPQPHSQDDGGGSPILMDGTPHIPQSSGTLSRRRSRRQSQAMERPCRPCSCD